MEDCATSEARQWEEEMKGSQIEASRSECPMNGMKQSGMEEAHRVRTE